MSLQTSPLDYWPGSAHITTGGAHVIFTRPDDGISAVLPNGSYYGADSTGNVAYGCVSASGPCCGGVRLHSPDGTRITSRQ